MSADKLVDSTMLDSDLTSVANAIRTKGGTSAPLLFPEDFVSAIMAISTGVKRRYTGDIVNFNTGSSMLIEAQIEPVQSGSGDPSPSNVRPISGWNEATLTRTGINLYNSNTTEILSAYLTASGNLTAGGVEKTFLAYLQKGTYFVKKQTNGGNNHRIRIATFSSKPTAGATGIPLLTQQGNSAEFTLASDTWIACWYYNGVSADGDWQYCQTHTSLCLYYSITINLDGIRYGGKLNVVTGVLTVTKANISSYAGETLPGEWISDRDVYAPGTTPTIGAQVVYDLETAQTIQLTPQNQVTIIVGDNIIWANTGDVTVEYAEIST